MTLRQLELFLALANNPRLGVVAKENQLTQSAVSMAIKALEESLEKRLFDRFNKKLILNENGRFFYRMVNPLVLGLKESENTFKDQDLRGDLKVGASTSIANYILPQIMYRFIEQYKGVTIQKITGNTGEIVRLSETGEVDIGFVEGEHSGPLVEKQVLGTDELYVVTGDKNLAQNPEYGINELLSKRWILREKGSGTREVFFKYLGAYKNRLKIYQELDNTEGIKSVLTNKNAISCLSRISVEKELAAGQLFRLNIRNLNFKRSFYTIWYKNKHFSSLLQEFLYFTKEQYRLKYD